MSNLCDYVGCKETVTHEFYVLENGTQYIHSFCELHYTLYKMKEADIQSKVKEEKKKEVGLFS